jgi:hypothetical protein
MLFGMVLVLVPLLAALSTAVALPGVGVVVSVVIGGAMLSVAIAGTRDQSSLAPSAHVLADRLLVLALLAAAVAFAFAGDPAIAVFFLALGVLEAALTLVTRYVSAGADNAFDEPLRRR